MATKKISSKEAPVEESLKRERDFLIETFSTVYDKYGEKDAREFMMDNKKVYDHLVPLRKMIEAEIADRLADAKESQSILELQLTEFQNSITNKTSDEMDAFKAVIKLVRKATPESIGYLKQFAKVISFMVDHMNTYSDRVNPKFKQSRVLKKVLDDLFMKEVDSLELAPTPPTNGKRKHEALTEAHSLPKKEANKKPRKGFGVFLDSILGRNEDENILLEIDEDDPDM